MVDAIEHARTCHTNSSGTAALLDLHSAGVIEEKAFLDISFTVAITSGTNKQNRYCVLQCPDIVMTTASQISSVG